MKVGVVGLGYVGLVTAAVLAENGNTIAGIDNDQGKIRKLREGKSPIYEPGLEASLTNNAERLSYSYDYKELDGCEIVYITVPTPNRGRKIDLSYVNSAIMSALDISRDFVIAVKSTVLPGTAFSLYKRFSIPIVSNPEFTREGSAMEDTRHPERIVIGASSIEMADPVRRLWEFTESNFLVTSNENAEMIKYASNSFLATKISFINEIANLCEKIPNCDVTVIAEGMGYDKRIAPYFLRAGLGYGGSCFPKDTEALISFARDLGEPLTIIEAAVSQNNARIQHVIGMIKSQLGDDVSGKKIAVMGVSFKDNTDDVRESPALKLIQELAKLGANLIVYNPVDVKTGFNIPVMKNFNEVPDDLDIIVVASEWDEFRILENKNLEIPVVDGRRILSPAKFKKYTGVGLSGGKA